MIDSVSDSAVAAPDLKRARRRKAGTADVVRTDRLPPHAPEAEQGVLGCVLLSPNDCLGQCIEKLKVGGIPYLNALQDGVPSAANLSYYLEIVLEKSLLRKMIHTCTDVVARVYTHEGEVDALLDEVERDVLRISESRATGESTNIKQLVHNAIGT